MLSRIANCGPLLSRLSKSSGLQARLCATQVQKSSNDNPLKDFKEGPERDLVNFPRRLRPLHSSPVKLGFIPGEWFDAFYNKTGVTGPYVLSFGFLTYILSKEIWVLEHEFYSGCSLFIVLYGIYHKFGDKIAATLDKAIHEEENNMNEFRDTSVDSIKEAITNEEKAQWMAQGESMLFDAKRENVQLQLEAEYRERLMNVYTNVKKRLDYQIEIQNSKRRFEQAHMVNWITDNVVKNITPQLEKESLQKCFSDLKALAPKA